MNVLEKIGVLVLCAAIVYWYIDFTRRIFGSRHGMKED